MRALFVVAGFTLLLARHRDARAARPGAGGDPGRAGDPLARVRLGGPRPRDAIEQAEKAKQTAKETSRFQRIVVAVATALAIAAAIAASILWEIPIVPYT